jgi:uncharacterized protein (DUF58 family)
VTGLSDLIGLRTPERPGPGPMAEGVLRALDLRVRRRIDSLLVGDYRASGQGEGTELAQVRPYQPGDDVRRIDWNVTARTQLPHVRVYVPERALTVWIVLDVSPSMHFGTADRRKADVAEGIALAVAHLATRRGNRLGVLTCGTSGVMVTPRPQGRSGLLGLLRTLRQGPSEEGDPGTPLAESLVRTRILARQRASIVVVSDFRGSRQWREPLRELAGRHDVIAVEIQDPREQEIPNVGHLSLIDPETGRQLQIDTSSRRLRERFAAAASQERREIGLLLRGIGVGHLTLTTRGDWLREFARFLAQRRRKR